MRKHSAALAALVVGLSVWGLSPGHQSFAVPGAEAEIVDRIVATVNDDVITLSDFYVAIPIFVQLNQVRPEALASPEGRRMLAARVLQELVNRALLDQEAEQHQLQVDRSAVDGFVERMARQSGVSQEDLRRQLRDAGIRYDDFFDYIRLELTKLRVMNVMVTSTISVSDDEVEAAFLERYPDGAQELHYDVSQILLTFPRDATDEQRAEVRAEMESIREQLVAGEPFEEMAEAHSHDPSRRRGGAMGEYERGQLPQAFENMALNLLPGEISAIFETRFGLHVVRLNNRWEEATVDIEEVREELYRELQNDKTNREMEQFLAQLHEDSVIQVLFDPTTLF